MGNVQITLALCLLIISINWSDICSQVPDRIYGSKSREADRLLNLAKEAMAEEQYQSALALLNSSLQYQTDNIDAYFNRAMVKEQIQDPEGALTDYQIVLLLDSTYQEAAFNRAKLRYQVQQYERSIEDFRKVLNMGSSGTQALYFKGTLLNKEGDVAMQGITTTVNMDADTHNYIGLCYQALNNHEAAISSFTVALKLEQGEANYYVNRGLSYVSLGKSPQAITDFKSALALDPEHAIARFNLTQELEQSGHLEASVYDNLIENHPEFTSAYVNRALVKLSSGDIEGAIQDYNQAISIDPGDPELYLNRGLAWNKAGAPKKALADFNQALELDELNAKAYRNRGQTLFDLQEYDLALKDMEQSIQLDPTHAASYFNRALIYHKIGNIDQTCLDLGKALNLGLESAAEALKAYCRDLQ